MHEISVMLRLFETIRMIRILIHMCLANSDMFITVAMICTSRAATNCDIFVLKKVDLDRVLSYYPEIAKHIQEVAKVRAAIARHQSMLAVKARTEKTSAEYSTNIDSKVTYRSLYIKVDIHFCA